MASISKPTLEIKNSAALGRFDATVKWTVYWSSYDLASSQPYLATVTLFGDDTLGADPLTAPALPFLSYDPIKSMEYTIYPGTSWSTARTDPFLAIEYSLMNEDKAPEPFPNPDEIRASVKLTPVSPKVAGPVESDVFALQLS
jgi:hypothetical protein